MNPGDWIALIVFVTGCVGSAFAFLNRKIDFVEAKLEKHAEKTVKDVWARAEEKFATREDLARLEGKIDIVLVRLTALKEHVEKR